MEIISERDSDHADGQKDRPILHGHHHEGAASEAQEHDREGQQTTQRGDDRRGKAHDASSKTLNIHLTSDPRAGVYILGVIGDHFARQSDDLFYPLVGDLIIDVGPFLARRYVAAPF